MSINLIPHPKPVLSAAIAHALAHPIRVEILTVLRKGAASVSDITEQLGRPQANISQHLAVLREVNLVDAAREGMSVLYCLHSDKVSDLLELLAKLGDEISPDEFKPRGRGGRHGRRRGGKRGKHHHGSGQSKKISEN